MQHAQSRFLKAAIVSRFLSEHPKVSRFIANHLPVLCPFLPMPHAIPARITRARQPKPSRFAP
jgi:hypothetical protein